MESLIRPNHLCLFAYQQCVRILLMKTERLCLGFLVAAFFLFEWRIRINLHFEWKIVLKTSKSMLSIILIIITTKTTWCSKHDCDKIPGCQFFQFFFSFQIDIEIIEPQDRSRHQRDAEPPETYYLVLMSHVYTIHTHRIQIHFTNWSTYQCCSFRVKSTSFSCTCGLILKWFVHRFITLYDETAWDNPQPNHI